MFDVSQDIRSLTDFKTRTPEFIAELRAAERAVLLTVNGRAEVAVMSTATFQRMLEALNTLDTLQGIKAGLDDIREGRTAPAEDFFTRFRKKHDLPENRV